MTLINHDLLKMLISQKTSHRELARYVGCHHSMIDHLLSGRRTTCRPQTAVLIAARLGVPVEALFEVRLPNITRSNAKGCAA
ncbi:MAG: helix-turn-helix domain-containing protein [Sciscionella sp.]